jgi:hypothetical protein
MKNVMIKNGSSYPITDIYEFLAGYTTKLKDKISVLIDKGRYYDTLVVNDKG